MEYLEGKCCARRFYHNEIEITHKVQLSAVAIDHMVLGGNYVWINSRSCRRRPIVKIKSLFSRSRSSGLLCAEHTKIALAQEKKDVKRYQQKMRRAEERRDKHYTRAHELAQALKG